MSLVLIKEPKAILNTHQSNWSAVQMPMVFEFQRQDQQAQMRYSVNNRAVVKLVGIAPSYAVVGDRIEYVSPHGFRYIHTITSIVGSDLFTDGIYSNSTPGGYVIFLDGIKNYFVQTELFDIDISNQYVSVGTIESRANILGVVNVNISEWLSPLGEFRNMFDYDQINKAMRGEGGKYQIRQTEIYDGSNLTTSTLQGLRYWTKSVKQIQEVYGNNMLDFVPTLDDTRVSRAKFLTDFVKPTYFVGFPFSLSFIYSDNLLNKQITRKQDAFDLNGDQIGSTDSVNVDYSQRTFVNRLMVNDSLASNVNEIDVWLESGSDVTGNGVGDGYIEPDVFDTIQPFNPNPRQPIPIGEGILNIFNP